MGLRFRKSINLGGGFRINISKSGIGYSWGVKGYRITKKSTGGTRHTVSLPGTGVSYVHETSAKKQSSQKGNGSFVESVENHTYDAMDYSNKNISSQEFKSMVESANRSLKYDKIATYGLSWLSIIIAIFYPIWLIAIGLSVICKILIRTKGVINLQYTIDDEERKRCDEGLFCIKKIAESKKIWRITKVSDVEDKKYHAGANSSVERKDCQVTSVLPFPFKSNEKSICFKCGKERYVFMPDRFFIIKNNRVEALNYLDFKTSIRPTNFIERDMVPSDAAIVGKTWKYVNKSGGPDRRFKDNREIPICIYGKLELTTSDDRMNIVLMFSSTTYFRSNSYKS